MDMQEFRDRRQNLNLFQFTNWCRWEILEEFLTEIEEKFRKIDERENLLDFNSL